MGQNTQKLLNTPRNAPQNRRPYLENIRKFNGFPVKRRPIGISRRRQSRGTAHRKTINLSKNLSRRTNSR